MYRIVPLIAKLVTVTHVHTSRYAKTWTPEESNPAEERYHSPEIPTHTRFGFGQIGNTLGFRAHPVRAGLWGRCAPTRVNRYGSYRRRAAPISYGRDGVVGG